jgi:outer membrane protein assembly factor BamB
MTYRVDGVRKSMAMWHRALALLVVVGLGTIGVRAEDWPQFRGPRGDGTWNGPALPEQWPEQGLRRLWNVAIGGGYAGVSVVQGRVFTMDRQTVPAERERVLCFAADTGELLWEHAYPVAYEKLDYGNGPRAQPTVHEGLVYTVGALGDVRCLRADNGAVVWQKSYRNDFGGKLPTWGYAGSPVIHGDRVLLVPGGAGASLVALHRETGAELWRTLSDEAGYSTPLVIQAHGRDQIVHWTPSHIRCVDGETGSPLWGVPYEVTYGVSIAKPIFHEELVFVAGYWEGSKAIRLGARPDQARLAWEENRFLRGLMSQPLYRAGTVYLLDKQYGLTAFALQTGKKLWDDGNQLTPRGRNPHASLVWLGHQDRIIALNENGELILARLNPAGYQETSRTKILGFTWAHPAFAGDRVYARSDTELVAVSLTD